MKLISDGFWGAKAMERRVIRCCAANPDCPFKEHCALQYDAFVDRRDPYDWKTCPGYRQSIDKRMENYHRLRKAGLSSVLARRHMTNQQTALLLAGTPSP